MRASKHSGPITPTTSVSQPITALHCCCGVLANEANSWKEGKIAGELQQGEGGKGQAGARQVWERRCTHCRLSQCKGRCTIGGGLLDGSIV